MAKGGAPPARPRVVAVAQQKGGTGKTTIVCNLAATIANIDPTVQTVIIDLDSQGSASLQMTGHAHAKTGAWDYVISGRMPKGFIQRTHIDTCLIIPATQRLLLSDTDMIAHDVSYPEIGRRLRANMRSVDLILIDCPAGFGAVSTMAMAIADLVLMPTQPAFFAVKSLRQTIKHVERLRRNGRDRCAIALSMIDADNPVHTTIADHIRSEFKSIVLPTPLPLDAAAEEAAATNTLVVETSPQSAVSAAYPSFAAAVMRRAGIEPKFDVPVYEPKPVQRPATSVQAPPTDPAPAAPEPQAQPAPQTHTAPAEPPPPSPATGPATLPPIPPPPGLGGPPVVNSAEPETPQTPETRNDPSGPPRPRLPLSPHDPPAVIESEPALTPPPSEQVEDPIPYGLRAKPLPSALEATVSESGSPPAHPRPKRRLFKRIVLSVFGAAILGGVGYVTIRFLDTADALLALGATALVAIPVLGYVFFVLKRV